jgi:hypothetical protein
MGQGTAEAASVMKSEKAFENIVSDENPEWARFIDIAHINGEHANTFRDLERPTETMHFAQISAEDAERQRGSFSQAAIARAALDTHDLAAAAAAATESAKLAAGVQSSRSIEAVVDLRNRLHRHDSSPDVIEFLEVSRNLLPV